MAAQYDIDKDRLAGKAVIVTGAGRGLGEAFARHAAACGAHVIVNDVDLSEAQKVVEAIKADGGSAVASGHSVADPTAARELAELCIDRFGKIDGLINNAAVFYIAAINEERIAEAERLVGVNLLGAMHCAAAVAPHMLAARRGSIINLASSAAFGLAGRGAYGATKAALISLTYSWALELKAYGVRVNALSPRASTRMNSSTPGMGDVRDIAPVATFLLSDLSDQITGQCVRASGLDLAWTLPTQYAPLIRRDTPGTQGVADALAKAEPGLQPFGFVA
ncbi:short-chain dehydrogenase [Sphingobium sp. SCG-1]|uniref:SDR family NAD(P)-dependent oxidoreductase n=1 Tax=Sphingobium sp. SCG-1 TaxID=2072936 RepID=UPI000CD6BB17|nr:SDR family oxidoreductase [Sphingobium sp. SCG-1]AUW59668.1 short-chain dehydrogenase [Sphingobium sp. SCG-1]